MEKFIKAEAIVLATTDFGDANRVVTFFTKEFGKIEANAYNCRRSNNPLSGAMQMFNHISLEFVKTQPVYRVHEAEIIDFYNINEDLMKIAYASIFFEIANKMTPIGQVDDGVFYLLLDSLKAFDKRNPRIATLIAACQFIQISGFALEYPKSLEKIFTMFLNFDWQENSKFSIKSGELIEVEKIIMKNVQSLIESPLNSLKFLESIKLLTPKK